MNIVAQMFGAIATITNAIGIQFKTKKEILISYIVACLFFVLSFYLLKAYSGAVTCLIMGIEAFINYMFDSNKKRLPIWLTVMLLITSLIITSLFYQSWVDILAIISCIPFILMLIQKKEKYIRIFTLTFLLFYTIYDILVCAYTTFIGDSLFTLSTIISIIRYDVLAKKK
jgi:uncharacterized membrane protein (DUF485 family)